MKGNFFNRVSLKTTLSIFLITIVLTTSFILGTGAVLSIRNTSQLAVKNYDTAMNDGYRAEIKSQIQSVISLLQVEYDRFQAGEMTEDAAKDEAKELIRGIRYREDGSGYFWIDNLDYILVMHPILPEQEGDNRYNLQDQNGVMIIQEILKAVQDAGADGYNEFYYTKSDGTTVAPKVAYSELFEPWGWVVSTGNYVDDMHREMEQAQKEINQSRESLIHIFTVVCIVILISVTILARVFGNWMCNPLIRLVKVADDISVGKIGKGLVYLDGNNEIVKLQNRFCDVVNNFKWQADIVNSLAEGNLTMDITPKSPDDIVGNALKKLAADNNDTLLHIREVAMQIDQGSGQIANASRNLADVAVTQAGAVESITASATDIAIKSKKNTKEVDEVGQLVTEANHHVGLGNIKMDEMLQAMAEIRKSSENIGIIIQTIDNIAFNTNILALNASVEAARAGEHGKGFAVVAGEVRKLAGQSAHASNQTTELIEDAIQKIKRGVSLAEETSGSLKVVSEYIGRIHALSQDIAVASKEQASSAARIDSALVQVSDTTQTNSATSQQCAAASVELSNQAKNLNVQLEKFRLKEL